MTTARETPAHAGTAAAPPPILVARGLTKRFGAFQAVADVDLELVPGRVTALIGPNGAGKSTIISMLSGLLLPTRGEVIFREGRIDGSHAHEIARMGLARTFQTPKLFEGMTVLETSMVARDRYFRSGIASAALRLPRMWHDEAAAEAAARRWLEFVGLGDAADQVATAMPVGHQRLIDVARALATEPDVLLLDEPAAGLDPTETRALGGYVRSIAKLGVAVLLVEHDMRLVMSIADHVYVLDQGRRIAEGTPAEVGADPLVVTAYLGTVHE